MGMTRRHILWSLIPQGILLSLFTLVFSSCTESRTPVEIASAQGMLLLGNGSEPHGLDPHLTTGVPEHNILHAIFEGLIAYHPTDESAPEPGVAESWEHNSDASVWTFHLRHDARWSNGDPVLASDFSYSIRRILSPALGAQYADQLIVLKGAEDFLKGNTTDFATVGVEVVDTHTLRLHLIGPTPHLPGMLKHNAWYPVNPRVIEAFGSIDSRESDWTRPENLVGNGAFRISRWVTNSYLEVLKSDTYWDADRVRIKGIRFFPIEKASTEEAAFRAGQIHYCSNIPIDRIEFYRSKHPEVIRFDDYLGTYFYRFNTTRPPLDQPLVRRALSLAIDTGLIVREVTRGGETPARGFVYDGVSGYHTPGNIAFDPETARRLLAEAGFPEGSGFPKMDILINTQEAHKMIAEAIQQMWRDHLGIDVGIVNQEWKVYLDNQVNLRYSISRSGWIGDYVDPITFLMIWTSDSGNNQTGWSNHRFDELYKQVLVTGDPGLRNALMAEMESIFLDELPVAPIYWYTRKYLLHPDVKNWHPKLLDYHPFKFIQLEPTGFRL